MAKILCYCCVSVTVGGKLRQVLWNPLSRHLLWGTKSHDSVCDGWCLRWHHKLASKNYAFFWLAGELCSLPKTSEAGKHSGCSLSSTKLKPLASNPHFINVSFYFLYFYLFWDFTLHVVRSRGLCFCGTLICCVHRWHYINNRTISCSTLLRQLRLPDFGHIAFFEL